MTTRTTIPRLLGVLAGLAVLLILLSQHPARAACGISYEGTPSSPDGCTSAAPVLAAAVAAVVVTAVVAAAGIAALAKGIAMAARMGAEIIDMAAGAVATATANPPGTAVQPPDVPAEGSQAGPGRDAGHVDRPAFEEEQAWFETLQASAVVNTLIISETGHVNTAYHIHFEDGSRGVYKPRVGESAEVRENIPADGLAGREVAAYRVDYIMGFGRVPVTTLWDGPDGEGSIQRFVESARIKPASYYSQLTVDQMAVLDYVIGSSDRHGGNYLSGADGQLAAIDNGYAFPESKDSFSFRGPATSTSDSIIIRGIRSDFVAGKLNCPLDDHVVAQVRAVDPDRIRHALHSLGMSSPAIAGTLERLREVQIRGMITGESWPGRITEAIPKNIARESLR